MGALLDRVRGPVDKRVLLLGLDGAGKTSNHGSAILGTQNLPVTAATTTATMTKTTNRRCHDDDDVRLFFFKR